MKRKALPLLILLAWSPIFLFPASSSAQAIHGIENRRALDSFFSSLTQVQTRTRARPVRIIQYGDSHTVAAILPGTLKRLLWKDFGPDEIIYDVQGRNGMRAWQLLEWMRRWTQKDLDRWASIAPDLIVVAYGSNEVTDNNWSGDSYARMFSEILSRFRQAAPRASILVLAPPCREVLTTRGWQPAERMPLLLDAQRRAAFSSQAGFWNTCDAMGGYGAMNLWVSSGLGQGDHVHLMPAGYVRLGSMFFYDLILAFNEYVQLLNERESDATNLSSGR